MRQKLEREAHTAPIPGAEDYIPPKPKEQKKKEKVPAPAPAPAPAPIDPVVEHDADPAKKARNIQKKLRAIQELQEKIDAGAIAKDSLLPEQVCVCACVRVCEMEFGLVL